MSDFIGKLTEERAKQILDKGYSTEHDDAHTDGVLSVVAACYALNKLEEVNPMVDHVFVAQYIDDWGHTSCAWPHDWPDNRDKKDRKESLVVAAALLMAEYERLERAEENKDAKG